MSTYPVWCTDCYGCVHNTGPVKEPVCARCLKTSMDGLPSEYKQEEIHYTTVSTTSGNEWRGDSDSTEAK